MAINVVPLFYKQESGPYHEMFSTEDDPERKQHGVEDALTDVTKQQHPGPVETH